MGVRWIKKLKDLKNPKEVFGLKLKEYLSIILQQKRFKRT